MGLDMYLNARMYVSKYSDEKLHTELNKLTESIGFSIPANEIVFEAAYWRKANHIHQWFVDNVQDGQDNCGYYDVSGEDIERLISVCEEVLADHSKADELLPTQSGFFFGSTEYDEYYFEDIKQTIKMLKPLLDKKFDLVSFYYHASW